MPSVKHTHTYFKSKTKKGYFKCMDPRCSHNACWEDVIGKYTCCTKCGAEFVMSRLNSKLVRPLCVDCSETREDKLKRAAGNLVSGLFTNLADKNNPTNEINPRGGPSNGGLI